MLSTQSHATNEGKSLGSDKVTIIDFYPAAEADASRLEVSPDTRFSEDRDRFRMSAMRDPVEPLCPSLLRNALTARIELDKRPLDSMDCNRADLNWGAGLKARSSSSLAVRSRWEEERLSRLPERSVDFLTRLMMFSSRFLRSNRCCSSSRCCSARCLSICSRLSRVWRRSWR